MFIIIEKMHITGTTMLLLETDELVPSRHERMNKVKAKLVTLVEGDPKAPFSITTTQWCRGGAPQFPLLLHFTFDPYFIMPCVKQGGIKYHFWVFGMTRPGNDPCSRGPLANTLLIRPTLFAESSWEDWRSEGMLGSSVNVFWT